MMYWLLVIILAYFLFGFASLCDKLILVNKTQITPKPKSYTFYVGLFGLFTIFLIPFANFGLPNATGLLWIVLDAITHLVALYTLYIALVKLDVSRVISTIGATQPIFIFILTWVFWGPQVMSQTDILAFVMLFVGSIVISIDKTPKITFDYLKITLLSSVLFSLDYIFVKLVFLSQPFLQGVIWLGIFTFVLALFILISKNSRKEIFSKQVVLNRKTQTVFWGAQISGGVANFLQNFAISLAPVAFLATMNSLRGIQYGFLFIMALLISYFYPKILKEDISRKMIAQKVIAIILIAIGLAILVVY